MAQNLLFTPHGALYVKAGTSYTSLDIPTGMDVVLLSRGVRITDENGVDTRIRGLKVLVEITGETYPKDNVPFVWWENEFLAFLSTGTYTFYDDGIVTYGIRTAV